MLFPIASFTFTVLPFFCPPSCLKHMVCYHYADILKLKISICLCSYASCYSKQAYIIFRPESKIRREVLDWSPVPATAPLLMLNISIATDPRLSKSKMWNLWKTVFFIKFFLPRPIRLIVLIVYSFLFKTLQFQNRWPDLHETENIDVYDYYPQHKEIFCSF